MGMRKDHKGRMVLLAAAVLCLTLFVAVPAAMAAGPWGGYTLFEGFTYGQALNKTAPVPTQLDISATTTSPPSSDTLDTGPFYSATDGFYALLVNAGAQGYYTDLQIVVKKVTYSGGIPSTDANWKALTSAIESNPDQVVPTAFYLAPVTTDLKVTVKNSKTGKAIKGATVNAYGHTATTASNGKATLSNLAVWPGIKFSFKVSKSGYHSKTVKASAFPNGTRSVTVKLSKS
jgi:hypothetical protein